LYFLLFLVSIPSHDGSGAQLLGAHTATSKEGCNRCPVLMLGPTDSLFGLLLPCICGSKCSKYCILHHPTLFLIFASVLPEEHYIMATFTPRDAD